MKKSGVPREEIFLETKIWPAFYEQADAVEKTLERLDTCEVKPAILQTEVHPYFQERELKAFLEKNGMVIQAWYPLGHGDKALIAEPVFTELAGKYGKSNAQIILRWHVQAGNIVIPGSKNPDHIRDNFALFDFELTEDEPIRLLQSQYELGSLAYWDDGPSIALVYKASRRETVVSVVPIGKITAALSAPPHQIRNLRFSNLKLLQNQKIPAGEGEKVSVLNDRAVSVLAGISVFVFL